MTNADKDFRKAAQRFMDWLLVVVLGSVFLFGAGTGFVVGIIATLLAQYVMTGS